MFATLLGGLPRPPLDSDASLEALVEAAVRAQEQAGLDPITDGGLNGERDLPGDWTATQRLTDRVVKAAVTGPYSTGRSAGGATHDRSQATLTRARTLNAILRDLVSAGCPLIEIHEPAAISIGTDEAERALFRESHRLLLDDLHGSHFSLALTGGNADTAGIETLLSAPYASLAVDLIAGPDNWRLVAATPGDRGIICGAMSAAPGSDDGPEVLLWAAGYAASTSGRGSLRVGLATASSFANLPWEDAVRKLERLGEAARLAARPPGERAQAIDPRAVDGRSAALGRVDRPPSRGSDRGQDPT